MATHAETDIRLQELNLPVAESSEEKQKYFIPIDTEDIDNISDFPSASFAKLKDVLNEVNSSYNDLFVAEYAQRAYAVGDYCLKDRDLYRCNTAIPSAGEVWTAVHWTKVQFVPETQKIVDDAVVGLIASAFALRTYAVGDYCIRNRTLYRCITAIPIASSWDASKWEVVKVADVLQDLEDRVYDLEAIVAPEYDSASTYSLGDYCRHDGKLYRSTWPMSITGTWDSSKWSETTIGRRLKLDEDTLTEHTTSISRIKGDIAAEYSTSKAYAVGDYCLRDDYLYVCNTAIASPGEAWTAAHWTRTSIGDEIISRISQAGDMLRYLATAYSADGQYGAGEYVTYDAEIYKAKVDISAPAGDWDSTKWEAVTAIGEELEIIFARLKDLRDDDAAVYDGTRTYAVGDFCIANGYLLYRCTRAITTPQVTFNATYWEQISLTELIDEINELVDKLLNDIATKFSTSKTYAVGEYCIYDGQLYRCKTAITTAGTWVANRWDAVTVGERLTIDETDISKLKVDLAAAYSASSTYAIGDYCLYDGQLYRCTTAITTAEAWNAIRWTATSVEAELKSIFQDLAPRYSMTAAYAVDEYVIYNRQFYKCIEATGNPAGAFNVDKWSAVSIGECLKTLKQSLDDVLHVIAAEYSATKAYYLDQYCIHDGLLYKCTTAIGSAGEVWNENHWSNVLVGTMLYDTENAINLVSTELTKLRRSIARDYSTSSAYDVNSFCTRNGYLYRCNTAIAAPGEAWTASHWTQTVLTDLIGTMASLNFVEVTS